MNVSQCSSFTICQALTYLVSKLQAPFFIQITEAVLSDLRWDLTDPECEGSKSHKRWLLSIISHSGTMVTVQLYFTGNSVFQPIELPNSSTVQGNIYSETLVVVIEHRTFTVKSTRNTSTAWISCRNTDTDADPREPKQYKDRLDGTIDHFCNIRWALI